MNPTRHRAVALALAGMVAASLAGQAEAVPQKRSARRAIEERTEAVHERLTERVEALVRPGARPSNRIVENFKVLGHVPLGGKTPDGDVFFFRHRRPVGAHAYVGTWSNPCSGRGVKIVKVKRPGRAKLVAVAGTQAGVSNEDVAVLRIGRKDVLAVGVQACEQDAQGGLALFNVTDPSTPKRLSFLPMPVGGVHELDVVNRADGRVFALVTVPFAEVGRTLLNDDVGGDFRVVDITRPKSPRELATWGVIGDSSLPQVAGKSEVSSIFQGIGYFAAHYDHGVRATDGGNTAYVSYWDGGVLKFDIRDPATSRLVGRTTFPFDADGDAHSMALYEAGGERYILQNDEDVLQLSPTVVTSSATGTESFAGIEHIVLPTILSLSGPVSGEVHDAGDGCQASDFNGATGKVALADVTDPFYEQFILGWKQPCQIELIMLNAADAGATALLLNLVSRDDAYLFIDNRDAAQRLQTDATGMPAVMVSDIDGLADAIRSAPRNQTVTVTLTPGEPAWGFMRVFRESTGADADGDGVLEFEQVGEFSTLPGVTGELIAPPGTWSVHNTEVLGDRSYSSWYSHGIVALDLSDPANPAKVGQFAPPSRDEREPALGEGPAMVWGVAIDKRTGRIYASDMRTGLWILKATGPAAPSG